MSEIKLLPPKPEDTWEITKVFYKSWLSTYPNEKYGITVDDIEDRFKIAFSPKDQERRKNNIVSPAPNSFRLIAKDGDKIIGTFTLMKDAEKNQLRAIYILPEYQGRGIGTMMWKEIKERLDTSKKTIVHVAEYNKKAIAFYEKLGFKDTGKRWSDEKFRMKSGSVIPEMEMELVY